jgi:hypothetical protein
MNAVKGYSVVFRGEIAPGYDVAYVKANLSGMLKRKDDSLIDRLFAGKPYILKTFEDYEGAKRYSDYFNKCGAISIVEPAKETCVEEHRVSGKEGTGNAYPPGGGKSEAAVPKHPLRRAEDARKCIYCGKTIKASESVCPCRSVPSVKACPACGEEIERTAEVCRYCSHILDSAILSAEKVKTPKVKKKTVVDLMIGIVLCILGGPSFLKAISYIGPTPTVGNILQLGLSLMFLSIFFVGVKKIRMYLVTSDNSKSRFIALMLCLFLGFVGGHSFYAGKYVFGILQLLTMGGFGIWNVIDFVLIAIGRYRDGKGHRITKWR